MRKLNRICVALLVLLFAHGIALAQESAAAGDPQAGKALWEGDMTMCRFCHGGKGEGAFGPDLAGRGLTLTQFKQAVRKPWGVMPAFIDTQLSDAEIANLHAYLASLPANSAPGKWRFDVPPGAPRGQVTLITMGCAQCHEPGFDVARVSLGAGDVDFDTLKNVVYNHTTAWPEFHRMLGEPPRPRLRMGNFNPNRLWETQLRDIYDWLRNDIGFRASIRGRLSAGTAAANGVTYTLNVENSGLAGKGLTAEDMTIRLAIPAGVKVVAATGNGYKGVQTDDQAKTNVAVWQVASMGPADHQTYTITLSHAATAADNLRGAIRWTKLAAKPGAADQINIAPAPL